MSTTPLILAESSPLNRVLDSLQDVLIAPHAHSTRWLIVIALMIMLIILLRQGRKTQVDFKGAAFNVLEERYRKGELSEDAYRKAQRDLALRPK
jgi:hypothetical protein